MNEINNNNKKEIELFNNIINPDYENKQILSKYKNMNNIKKNKTTQLFESLLGSRLILTSNSNMLIEKPFTIFEILDIIHSNIELDVKMEIIDKIKMIVLKHRANSSIILEKSILKDSKSEINISFMDELISILIDNSREPKLIEELLNLLEILIQNSGPKLDYFWNIFRRISKLCERNKTNYDGTKFLLLLKIINKLFTKSIYDDISNPSKFIFFNNNTSELLLDSDTLQSKNINLINGFTFGIWVFPEKVQYDSTNKNISPNSTLFYIKTNKNFIIEATLEDNNIYYYCGNNEIKKEQNNQEDEDNQIIEEKKIKDSNIKNINKSEEKNKLIESKKSETIDDIKNKEKKFLGNIEYDKWSLLLFTHKPEGFLQKPQFIFYINNLDNEKIIDYEYPNFGNQKISKLGICKGFTGLVSNIFMFNQALVQKKIIEEMINYNFGLYNEQNINLFKSYIEQEELHDKSNNEKNKNFLLFKEFFKSIMFIYSPCRAKGNNIIIDLVNNINAELNIQKELNLTGGFYLKNNYGNNIYHIGGASIFLPIYEYIFSSIYNSSIILEEGIQIMINIFKNESYYIGQKIKEDKHFFRNLYYIIDNNLKNKNDDNTNLFTKEIMTKFYELGQILINNDKQKTLSKSFFDYIFLNINLIKQYPLHVQKELYQKLKDLYIKNCEYLFSIFDVKDILKTIVKLYDNNANYYCCKKHYQMLNEDQILDLKGQKNKNNKIYTPSLLNKIYDLLEIMKYILTNDKIITISQIHYIILVLISEISPCLQIALIKILQTIFGLNQKINPEQAIENGFTSNNLISMEKEYIKTFCDNKGIEHLLYIMSTSTLDIRYECLKLFYLICCSEDWNKNIKIDVKKEIMPFICINLFEMKNNRHSKMDITDFNVNDILFTGKDEIYINNENLDKMKNELDDEINSLKSNNENDIINDNLDIDEHQNNNENILIEENSINVDIVVRNLSIPINYIKNYSNKINDIFVEKIYIFLMQWLINNFENPISLDDSDEIFYPSILTILMNYVSNNGIIIKSKFLRDLYTLSYYNQKNCKIILENKYFHQWLLDTLLIYQILSDNGYKDKTLSHKGICESILSLGIKLHNIIIVNATIYGYKDEIENNANYINNHIYIFQFLITWLYKVKKIGNILFLSAYNLINNIISDLINRLKPMLTKENIIQYNLIWTCFLNLFLIAYEFYFIYDYCMNKNLKHNSSILINTNSSKNNLIFEKNPFFSFVINEEVLYNIETNTSPNIQKNNKILLSFFQNFKIIWDLETKDIKVEDNIPGIEDFLNTIIFGQRLNEFSLEMNLLLYSTEDLPLQDIKTNSIMESILNIIIMFIKTSKTKEDIINWINELKKFLIYLIIISHNINPEDKSILTKEFIEGIKDKVSSVFILASNFIRNEIKNLEENNNDNMKLILDEYKKLFRFLFISYILIIERYLIEKEKKQNNNGGFLRTLTSALGTLKNIIFKSFENSFEYSPFITLYKEIFLNSQNEPLFNLKEIDTYKNNNFEEFFKKIKTSQEWKNALFENQKTLNIINNQFALNYYEKNTKIRISNGDNIHINRNISINEKRFISGMVGGIGEIINKSLKRIIKIINQDIFKNIICLKKSQTELSYLHKKYFNWKGKWIYLNEYMNKVNTGDIKFKLGNHYCWDFICTCLYSIDNFEKYLPIFNKYDAKKYLFLEEIKENKSDIDKINLNKKNKNKNFDKDWTSFKVLRTTNKGNLFNIYEKNENENNINDDEENSNDSEINEKREMSNLLYKKENYENYNEIQKLLQYSSNFLNSTTCIIDITKLYIEKLMNTENKNKKPSKIYYDCCLVKPTGHIPGCLLCSNDYIYYIINYNYGKVQTEDEKCVGSLFRFDPNKHKIMRKIEKKNIRQIFKRRYYYIENSLELFTHTNKSYFIKFNSNKDRDEFHRYIFNSYNELSLLKEDALSITKKWEHWDISTLSFLSFLNNFAGRSFKDLTQYPVFPWILKDYESQKLNKFNETNIRELNKPIGALGSEQRLECFLQNYKESKELEIEIKEKNNKKNNEEKKIKEKEKNKSINTIGKDIKEENHNNEIEIEEKRYFYSSHYSNPFYVVHYMSKIFPYSFCAIELQGDGFDKRERQFLSMIDSWNNCMNENTDLRELIPEFFFLPEMFINFNKINFFNEKKEKNYEKNNNDFEYPKWSKNNSNLFVIKNRLALESDFVSDNINEWIDLIFGFKQRGEEAEKVKNLFFDFTYEGTIDIEKYKKINLDEYNSLITKVDIGQTPSQIFTKSVDKRIKRKDINLKKIINFEKISKWKSHSSQSEKINSISYSSNLKELSKKMLIYIKALKNRRIICIFNNGVVLFLKEEYTLFSESGLVFINEKTIKIPTDLANNRIISNINYPTIIEEDFDIITDIEKEQPITCIINGKYIIKGGFYDSKFTIHETFHVHKNKFIYVFLEEESKISVIKTDGYGEEEEKYLYIGTTNGKLFIYKINKNAEDLNDLLKYHTLLIEHTKSIKDIYIDQKLNILTTVSADKTCNIYTYPELKLFRVISLNELNSLDNVFISNMPLPAIIIYSKDDSLFYVFTINGSFILKKKNMFKEIYSPKISKDVYGRDYLIYGTKYKVIVICRLPLFTKEECIEIKNDSYNFPIKSLELREESEIIYFWRLHNYNLSYLKNKIVNSSATADNINLYI